MFETVRIAKSQSPSFPDLCVQCGKAAPGATVTVRAGSGGDKPLGEDVFASWKVEVPCCEGCRGAVRRHRWIARFLFGLAVLASVVLWGIGVTLWPGVAQGWGHYVLILAAVLIPQVVVRSLHQAAIEIMPSGDQLVFELRDPAFAKAFAELNGTQAR